MDAENLCQQPIGANMMWPKSQTVIPLKPFRDTRVNAGSG
jgi:hypothetical protein